MPGARAEYVRLGWLLNNGMADDEPCKLILPRRDAKERIRNEAKSRRIVLVTDEHGFSQFHARKEAWMQALENNPTLFMLAMDTAMSEFDVLGWKEKQEGEQESLGDA